MTGILHYTKLALMVLFNPVDFLDVMKRDRAEDTKGKLLSVIVLHALAFLANYSYVFIVSFPLSSKEPSSANYVLELCIITVPLLTWVIATYAMSSILSGESKLIEILTTASYALVPFILFTPCLALASHVFSGAEQGIYEALRGLVLVWVLVLLLAGLSRLNDYSAGKTMVVTALSVIAMVIIWAIALLLFSLTIQLFSFFGGFFKEINLKYFY